MVKISISHCHAILIQATLEKNLLQLHFAFLKTNKQYIRIPTNCRINDMNIHIMFLLEPNF